MIETFVKQYCPVFATDVSLIQFQHKKFEFNLKHDKFDNPKVRLNASPSDVRFFANLFIGKDDLWHFWVTAACGKTAATKFRAEIRLASSTPPSVATSTTGLCNGARLRESISETIAVLASQNLAPLLLQKNFTGQWITSAVT